MGEKLPLSKRVRPDCEAAPWVIEEIAELEERQRVEQSCNRCKRYHGKEPCNDIADLENGLRDVGEVHDSWNASDEFKKGWAKCREQFRALLSKEKDDE